MRDRQTILIFPGGSREVNKRRDQQYQLLWRERIGYAWLAIEHVPLARLRRDAGGFAWLGARLGLRESVEVPIG